MRQEKISSTSIKNLVSFFFEVGTLRKIARSHRQTLLTDDLSDNIASHSFRVAIIGYFLSKEVGAETNKVVKMCLFHDVGETRSGDQNWVHKRYVKTFEKEIEKGQLKNLPKTRELLDLIKEYNERKTLEARTAKEADLLDEDLLLKEYEWRGNKEAKKWLKGKNREKRLYSKIAKQIAEEIKKQRPSLWWDKLWTDKRR